MPPTPLEGVLTPVDVSVPGAVMSVTLPVLGRKLAVSSGLVMLVTLKLEMAGGSTLTGASSANCELKPGALEGSVLEVVVVVLVDVVVLGVLPMVKLVTPKDGVLMLKMVSVLK